MHACSRVSTHVYTCCYNEKTLKCKPSALLFGRGRAKKSIALQGSYNIGIHVKIRKYIKASAVARARGFDKAHALTKM